MAAEITASQPIHPRRHSAATNQQRAGEAPPHTEFIPVNSRALKGVLSRKGTFLGNDAAQKVALIHKVQKCLTLHLPAAEFVANLHPAQPLNVLFFLNVLHFTLLVPLSVHMHLSAKFTYCLTGK